MSMDYFAELPPELITLVSPLLPTTSVNALALTCRRLREILQPELESRITPKLRRLLLLWAADSNLKPHIIVKLLSAPHPTSLAGEYGGPGSYWNKTPLHVAAEARNLETATLLLEAGASPAAEWDQDEYQPLHLAAQNNDLAMMRLLLDHGAPLDAFFGCDGCSESALHLACSTGNLEMVQLLLDRGAIPESRGHYGTTLGFAVNHHRMPVVEFLLKKGADASVTVPMFILLVGGPPSPHSANLLYIAMGLRHPSSPRYNPRKWRELPKWQGLPLPEGRKRLMALLMAHGASKATTMTIISRHLTALSKEVEHTEHDFLAVIAGMLQEAEDAIPDVMAGFE
ncbi:ankyrin repeat-containing domain protein [Mycena crocata]|nr:ankyrin repeat-containing domain protein [Mycena crocata]